MKVYHLDPLKRVHEALAHSAKGGISEVAMISEVAKYADSSLFQCRLRGTDEFHVVVL
jgi:hypothetical protein